MLMVRTLTVEPATEAAPSITPSSITCAELRARVTAAHEMIGCNGRFSVTISFDGAEQAYITHWFRTTPTAFEDCRTVASGTLADCLAGLERYAENYRPSFRPMSGADLGIADAPAYGIAAE